MIPILIALACSQALAFEIFDPVFFPAQNVTAQNAQPCNRTAHMAVVTPAMFYGRHCIKVIIKDYLKKSSTTGDADFYIRDLDDPTAQPVWHNVKAQVQFEEPGKGFNGAKLQFGAVMNPTPYNTLMKKEKQAMAAGDLAAADQCEIDLKAQAKTIYDQKIAADSTLLCEETNEKIELAKQETILALENARTVQDVEQATNEGIMNIRYIQEEAVKIATDNNLSPIASCLDTKAAVNELQALEGTYTMQAASVQLTATQEEALTQFASATTYDEVNAIELKYLTELETAWQIAKQGMTLAEQKIAKQTMLATKEAIETAAENRILEIFKEKLDAAVQDGLDSIASANSLAEINEAQKAATAATTALFNEAKQSLGLLSPQRTAAKAALVAAQTALVDAAKGKMSGAAGGTIQENEMQCDQYESEIRQ